MANVADLIRAYEGRTDFASTRTNSEDDSAADAWAALRAIVAGESAGGCTLADRVLFRADPSAPLYTVHLDNYGRALSVEVAS